MILPDAVIWIDHLRSPIAQLNALLGSDRILGHPFVTGEVSLGSLRDRDRFLTKLGSLPQLRVASAGHVATLIESARLHSRGIGYVDAHLLASVLLTPGTSLWTRDKWLAAQAERLEVAALF